MRWSDLCRILKSPYFYCKTIFMQWTLSFENHHPTNRKLFSLLFIIFYDFQFYLNFTCSHSFQFTILLNFINASQPKRSSLFSIIWKARRHNTWQRKHWKSKAGDSTQNTWCGSNDTRSPKLLTMITNR